MSKEQIEEIAKAMCGNGMSNGNCAMDDELCNLECVYGCCAERLHAKGYRKQSEGEWGFDGMSWTCSECGEYATKGIKTSFCPNCGARMSGGNNDGYNNK